MNTRATVMIQVGPGRLERRDVDVPPLDVGGLLRIEASGLCGTDLEQFLDEAGTRRYPLVPGHEAVGSVVALAEEAAMTWPVALGDRVVVEPLLQCGRCRTCCGGDGRMCVKRSELGAYSTIPWSRSPGLWGSWGTHMYLDPSCVMHPIPDDLPVELAVMTNSLANAVEWSVQTPGTRLGDHVVLLGCGQRGLMSVVAAKAAGAKTVVVTGLSHDQHKLKLARQLGADAAVDVQNEALRPIVADVTGGDMADVVVDLTPMDVGSLGVAVEVAADGGCLVIAGLKSGRPTQVDTDVLVRRGLSLRTGLSARSAAFTQAVSLLDGRREAFSRLHTHRFPLDNVVGALDALRGNAPTPAISVVVDTK